MTKKTKMTLKQALPIWREKYGVSVSDFAAAMDYHWNYAADILNPNGKAEFTDSGLGRFLRVFGVEHTAELLKIAGVPSVAGVGALPAPDGNAERVPVLLMKTRKAKTK